MGCAYRAEAQGNNMPDDKPETMEVELLSGVKVQMPKEQALKEIEARQTYKNNLRSRDEELGRIKAEKDAELATAKKAQQDAEAAAAVKAGEFEKARQIYEKQAEEKASKLERNYRVSRLEALVAANQTIVPEAAKDIASSLFNSCQFDFATEQLLAIGQDGKPRTDQNGKPLSVDALIAEYAETRPYLRKATTSNGSGANAAHKGDANAPKTITQEEYDAAMKDPSRSQVVAKAVSKREIVIK